MRCSSARRSASAAHVSFSRLGCGALKIASPELNHFPLLRRSRLLRPAAVSFQRRLAPGRHRARPGHSGTGARPCSCTASPPTRRPRRSTTSRCWRASAAFSAFRSAFRITPWTPSSCPSLAVAHGACAVEKHFTLSRGAGRPRRPDRPGAGGFRRMVEAIRRAEAGTPRGGCSGDCGRTTALSACAAVTGSGVKAAGPLGARQLHPHQPLHPRDARDPQGRDHLREADVAVLRTEKVLRPGIGPEFLPRVIGATAKRRHPRRRRDRVGGHHLRATLLAPRRAAGRALAPNRQYSVNSAQS